MQKFRSTMFGVASLVMFSTAAFAATQTQMTPASVANDPSSTGTQAWTTALPATVSLSTIMSVPKSQYLVVTDFGFTIPAGQIITGIEVEVTKAHDELLTGEQVQDFRVRIVKGGAVGITDQAIPADWPKPAAATTYGGPTDLWGETWTTTDINASGFGFAISAQNTTTLCDAAYVNAVKITVHYEPVPIGYYAGYKITVAKTNLALTPISQGLPEPFAISLDDFMLPNLDADDPENFEVAKAKELLLPAKFNADPAPIVPDLHYMSYQIAGADEGISPDIGDGIPKAVKHVKRLWNLSNALGTILVTSSKVARVWVPTEKDLSTPPASPAADATHWMCYQVKAAPAYTAQTPGKCSSSGQYCQDDLNCGGMAGQFNLCLKPKFRSDLFQSFFSDQFADCDLDGDAQTQFMGTPVEKECLVNLKKPKLLCNPVTKSAVMAPRVSTAVSLVGSVPALTTKALLCYQVARASKISTPIAISVSGLPAGPVDQAKPASQSRKVKDGLAVFTYPGNGFEFPKILEKPKLDTICMPTDVTAITQIP